MLHHASGAGDLEFLTWYEASEGSARAAEDCDQVFSLIATDLARRNSVIIQERVFATLDRAPAILNARMRAYQDSGIDHSVPPTFVEGRPFAHQGLAGIHIIAVRSGGGRDERVMCGDNPCGRIVRGADAEYLGLSNVADHIVTEHDQLGPEEETREAFRLAGTLLTDSGWSFADVRRTWFYLHEILDWYEGFNRIRNAEFSRLGLFDPERAESMPASTGIYGCSLTGNHCTLDLLAIRPVEGSAFNVRRLVNPQQNEAPEYGSAFSRGLAVTAGRGEYLFVSGTASIDDQGESIHIGDFEAQARETAAMVHALLAAGGSSLADIGQATAFVKLEADVAGYEEVFGDKNLPIVCTLADVCRDELLFELDATVVRSAADPTDSPRDS